MAKVKVKLISAGMQQLLLSSGVRADLTRRAQQVLAQAQSSAPVASGAYRASLKVVDDTTDRAVERVSSDVPYAMLVEAKTGTLTRALDAAR